MATVNTAYTHALKVLVGSGNWLVDDVKLALLDDGYTFSAAHTLFDNGADDATDPSFSELGDGDGYPAGGAALTTGVTNTAISADPVTFTELDHTFLQGVVYIDGTVDTLVKPLLFHILFDDTAGGTNVTVPGIDFIVNNPTGYATLNVA
jgi:hypothetical protein